jgi:hypothetical protein
MHERIIYEMLTGQRLFKGDDLSEILAKAVVTAPFDPTQNHGLIFRWVTYAGQ